LLLLFWLWWWGWCEEEEVVFVSRLNSPMRVGWDVEDEEERFLSCCEISQIRERISGRERLARGGKA
jgi:hypothetical protein